MMRSKGNGIARVQSWARRTLAAGVTAALIAGCAQEQTTGPAVSNGGKYYSVTAEKTSFFRYGPQQGNGADLELPRDTLLTLIRPSFGYSKVQLVKEGQQGYVASEDIKIASATLIAAVTAPPPDLATSTHDPMGPKPRGDRFNLDTNDPRLAPPPEELPDPDLPPESPVP